MRVAIELPSQRDGIGTEAAILRQVAIGIGLEPLNRNGRGEVIGDAIVDDRVGSIPFGHCIGGAQYDRINAVNAEADAVERVALADIVFVVGERGRGWRDGQQDRDEDRIGTQVLGH